MHKSQSTSKIVLKFTGSLLQLFMNIILYTVVILLIINLGGKAYTFTYRIFGSVRVDTIGMNVPIQIYEDEPVLNVAAKLETSKVIYDKYSFYVKAKLNEIKFVPGSYIVNTSMDYDELLDLLSTQVTEEDED